MKQSLEMLEQIQLGSYNSIVREASYVKHNYSSAASPLRTFVREAVTYLDFSEAISKIRGDDFEEDKQNVLDLLKELKLHDFRTSYSEIGTKAMREFFGFSPETQMAGVVTIIEMISQQVELGTLETFWEEVLEKDYEAKTFSDIIYRRD
ncbi:hypothetical protein LCM10_04730 [Rossellomorea aquimaris]|uniref:hypothetical protein n=1 Tax=Rossellomorea aquimaris TaxID=189382 RepID=UPI001CD38C83|nr:hypothetical protein [Rossellomorea aquimaris]MCA1054284.1 hypothetical protein [Rossellomorea aquimaris]